MDVIFVKTDADVAALSKDVRTGKRRQAKEIRIMLDGLEKETADTLTHEINKYYFSCGCNEATALGLMAIAGAVIWMGISIGEWQSVGWRDAMNLAVIFSLAVGLGKLIGRWRANYSLKLALDKLLPYASGAREIGKGDGAAQCSIGK